MARRKQYIIADASTPFPTITANGNYPAAGFVDWEGGRGMLMVLGTFDSAVTKLQIQAPDGVTWLDVPSATFSANGVLVFEACAGRLRLNVASIVTASALKAWLVGIPVNN